jgi:serine/threonine protein kinase
MVAETQSNELCQEQEADRDQLRDTVVTGLRDEPCGLIDAGQASDQSSDEISSATWRSAMGSGGSGGQPGNDGISAGMQPEDDDSALLTFVPAHGSHAGEVVKRLIRSEQLSLTERERVLDRAQRFSELSHAHLAEVSDFGEDEVGNVYLVREGLPGRTLRQHLIETGAFPTETAISVLQQACLALAYLHGEEQVHGRLSPDAIVLCDMSLADSNPSGVAPGPLVKLVLDDSVSIGTSVPSDSGWLGYSAPEVSADSQDLSPTSDVFAWGTIARELLGGSAGKSPVALDLDPWLANRAPALVDAIGACLKVDPRNRPASMVDVAQRIWGAATRRVIASDELRGVRAGSYVLKRQLGSGGIASVWEAKHPVIGSRVAIKVLHPQVCTSAEAVRHFVIEAQAVNRIESPHIVKIFDFGKLPDGRDYAVMELLRGETLAQRLRREGPLSEDCVIDLGVQIARALAPAHEAGVVHRDLKPENIFLTGPTDRPEVKILDFGIAKLIDPHREAAGRESRKGLSAGTPLYVAPEQLRGAVEGPLADVYTMGIVLYELLTGQPPFVGLHLSAILSAKTNTAAPLLARHGSVNPDLARLVDSMVARDPAQRPQSMDAVLTGLIELRDAQAAAWSSSSEPEPMPDTGVYVRVDGSVVGLAAGRDVSPRRGAVVDHPRETGGRRVGAGELGNARLSSLRGSRPPSTDVHTVSLLSLTEAMEVKQRMRRRSVLIGATALAVLLGLAAWAGTSFWPWGEPKEGTAANAAVGEVLLARVDRVPNLAPTPIAKVAAGARESSSKDARRVSGEQDGVDPVASNRPRTEVAGMPDPDRRGVASEPASRAAQVRRPQRTSKTRWFPSAGEERAPAQANPAPGIVPHAPKRAEDKPRLNQPPVAQEKKRERAARSSGRPGTSKAPSQGAANGWIDPY